MSLWSEIQDRSSGELRHEDFKIVYPGKLPNKELLEAGEYKDEVYMIYTTGQYPFIAVTISIPISVFAGAGVVRLSYEVEGERVELKRMMGGGGAVYTLVLNRDKDFVLDWHEGKKYSLDTLREIAKDIIDQILKCEYDLTKRM